MSLTPLQRLAHILRKLNLLQLADLFWFFRLYWLNRKTNIQFMEKHPEALVPPPMILYDIQGNCDLAGFYLSGQEHAQEIARIIATRRPGQSIKILEWGCGPARVLQHLKSPDDSTWELWGSDYNSQTIAWCERNLLNIRFMHHGLEPPIPVENECFDVIYCISVFTHLSEARHHQWIAELLRLLKPGGLLIATFHGEAYRDQLTKEELRRFDAGELVFRDRVREGKKDYSAYHCDSAVRRLLAPFDVTAKLENPKGFRQTLWTAVKKGKNESS